MRSFEERKAEVFRRSENRIKERRKARSRALTVCIPLCLIITVWSVMVLPAMLPVNNKKSGATDERAEDISGAAYSQNGYVRIETKNSATKDQTAVLKDDPTEIAGVYHLVQSMLNNIVQTVVRQPYALSTCSYEYEDARYVVIGRVIEMVKK